MGEGITMGVVGQRLSSLLETAREARLMKGKPITMNPELTNFKFEGASLIADKLLNNRKTC